MPIETTTTTPKWIFYIIENKRATYAGISTNPIRRLRQHNKELSGGARYTTARAPGWQHVCFVSGFNTVSQALQFEWAVKHASPRRIRGIKGRIHKLGVVLSRPRWTSRAPLASSVPLVVEWVGETPDILVKIIPSYVKCI